MKPNSDSYAQASTINTDGIDTFYTNKITIRNWDVTCGDDAVSPKANTSNMLVQDSRFHDTSGIAIGSIGQYLGVFEFIENVTAERITCDRCRHLGYIKTWTGVQKGVPPNGTRHMLTSYPRRADVWIWMSFSRRRWRPGLREEHR